MMATDAEQTTTKIGMLSRALGWLIEQPPVAVLSIGLLVGGAWLAVWIVQDVVPAHIHLIRDGYKEEHERFQADLKAQNEHAQNQLKTVVESMDRQSQATMELIRELRRTNQSH